MNPNPPLAAPQGPQPTPSQVQPITPAELQAWVERREKFRGRVKAAVVVVLVLVIGGIATFWTLFHEQFLAIARLKSHNAIVDWDLNFKNFASGGETDVSFIRSRWGWSEDHRIQAEQLQSLGKLLHLKSLDLGGAWGMDDHDIAVIAKLNDLEHLQLYRTRDYDGKKSAAAFSDEALEYVKGLTSLHTLVLSDNNITDAGVAKLVNLTQLEKLDLDGTLVTDKSLETFKKMKNLRFVNVANTGVTKAATAQFRGQTLSIEITNEQIPSMPDSP